MTCEARSPVADLPCVLAAGHPLPHAHGRPGLQPFVSWPVAWTAEDQRRYAERHAWRKPHVRRTYQTLKTWKAAR